MLNVLAYEIFKSGKDADVTDTAKQRERRHGGRCEIKFDQNLPPILPPSIALSKRAPKASRSTIC